MNKQHEQSLINHGRSNTVSVINLILLVVILVLGLTGYFAGDAAPGNSWDGITKNDVKSAVELALKDSNVAAPAPAPQPTQPTPPPAPTKIDTTELEAFYETAYVKGAEDAKVTIIEFSDFECPFCKRHASQWTLDQVVEKYGDDVNVIFAHFPLSFHPLAQKAQEAAECVGAQGGAEAYYAFKEGIFNEDKPTRDAITKVVEALDGVDAAEVETCLDEGTYAKKVADAMAFGRKLGVTGTPGNIVMNNETGEFQKVSGAVPAAAFDGPISTILQ